jgi:DNA-binding MarR family transcriptional regulator
MDTILFSLKRAFHKSVAFGKQILRHFGLTPSRFDILYILGGSDSALGSYQCDIRRMLGIAGSTLSRMIDALEELGFVTRSRAIYDRRKCTIRLTEKGLRTIRRAIFHTRTINSVDFAVDNMITRKWWNDDNCFADRCRVTSMLIYMRDQLSDTAALYYPWHPDD